MVGAAQDVGAVEGFPSGQHRFGRAGHGVHIYPICVAGPHVVCAALDQRRHRGVEQYPADSPDTAIITKRDFHAILSFCPFRGFWYISFQTHNTV